MTCAAFFNDFLFFRELFVSIYIKSICSTMRVCVCVCTYMCIARCDLTAEFIIPGNMTSYMVSLYMQVKGVT